MCYVIDGKPCLVNKTMTRLSAALNLEFDKVILNALHLL